MEAYACFIKVMSSRVCASVGGLPYLLPDGSLSDAYLMVAAFIHLRVEAWPSAQLNVLLVP